MRLAVIRQRYTPFGGAERFLDSALRALAGHGVTVTLYTRAWRDAPDDAIERRIVDPFYIGGWWRDAGFARAVCAILARDADTLVQSHERLACCDIFRAGDGVHAAWLDARIAHMSPMRALGIRLDPHHRYRLAVERRMFASPRLRAVICNSAMVRDEIRARFGVPDERLHVIYNAVDSTRFSPATRVHRTAVRNAHRIADDALVFLHVGSGFERKGVATAIDALALLPSHGHLLVVGTDKHAASYAGRARARGVANRVSFAGGQTDVRPYYGAADAFVLATLYDPCPNAALEAMASGLPIVTTTRCGAAELALAHAAGLVCEPAQARALADRMLALCDAEARTRMGANARSAMLPLTAAAMTSRLLALYDTLLAARLAESSTRR
jgi:UDP-glucose:(heptosyl)LPS alpha-1,3-glucosyltransferase